MHLIDLLRKYVPDATVGFVPTDPDDEFYGEYDSELGFTFTSLFLELPDLAQDYVVLHEVAHCLAQNNGRHNDAFYEILTPLIGKHGIPMNIARDLEGIYPRAWAEVA